MSTEHPKTGIVMTQAYPSYWNAYPALVLEENKVLKAYLDLYATVLSVWRLGMNQEQKSTFYQFPWKEKKLIQTVWEDPKDRDDTQYLLLLLVQVF